MSVTLYVTNHFWHHYQKYDIISDCHVNAKAVYTGDGKWKVYEIEE